MHGLVLLMFAVLLMMLLLVLVMPSMVLAMIVRLRRLFLRRWRRLDLLSLRSMIVLRVCWLSDRKRGGCGQCYSANHSAFLASD
jgi:hypothetical protein